MNPVRPTVLDFVISRRRFNGLALGSAALGLAGCGGGGGAGEGEVLTITAQPGALSAAAGETVVLEVVASGSDLHYQWLRDGSEIAGATSSRLQFVMQPADDGASYTVRVSSGSVVVSSAPATLSLVRAGTLSSIALRAGLPAAAGNLEGSGFEARLGSAHSLAAGASGEWYGLTSFAGQMHLLRVSASGRSVMISWPGLAGQGGIEQDGPFVPAIATNSSGVLHVLARDALTLYVYAPDGTWQPVALSAESRAPALGPASAQGQLFFDAADRLHVFDEGALFRVSAQGQWQVVLEKSSAGHPLLDTAAWPPHAAPASDGSVALFISGSIAILNVDGRIEQTASVTDPVLAPPVEIGGRLFAAVGSSYVMRLGVDGSSEIVAGARFATGYLDAQGAEARFGSLTGIAIVSDGTWLVVDEGVHCVRRVDPLTRVTSTILGSPTVDVSLVDGLASAARFGAASGAVAASDGRVFVMEHSSTRESVRQVATDGTVSPVIELPLPAGGQSRFTSLAMDRDGNFHTFDRYRLVRLLPDGSTSLIAGNFETAYGDGVGEAAGFSGVAGLAWHPDGYLLVLESPTVNLPLLAPVPDDPVWGGHAVRRAWPDGRVETLFGNPAGIQVRYALPVAGDPAFDGFRQYRGMVIEAGGTLLLLDGFHVRVERRTIDGVLLRQWDLAGVLGEPVGGLSSAGVQAIASAGGAIYVGARNRLLRLDEDGSLTDLVDTKNSDGSRAYGVRLGPQAPSLGHIDALLPAPDGGLLCFSEGALLKLSIG